jgi:hypothetical protein
MCMRVFTSTLRWWAAKKVARREKKGLVPSFRFALLIFATTKRKGSGTPTDALSNLPCCWHGRALSRSAHAYRRSTTVLTQGTRHPKGPASGHASWDVAERRSCSRPHSWGRTDTVCAGVTRPRPVPVQRAPRGPVRSAGRLMPEAARERFAMPPAGAALAPRADVPPARVLHRARIMEVDVTETVTNVNVKVTKIPARLGGLFGDGAYCAGVAGFGFFCAAAVAPDCGPVPSAEDDDGV